MTALGADKIRLTRGVPLSEVYTVKASVTLYRGAAICVLLSDGKAQSGTSAAGVKFVGLCQQSVTQTASSAYQVTVEYGHEALFDTTANVTVALIGSDLCITDDTTLDTYAGVASNQIKVGEMISLAAATKAWVAVRRPCGLNS